MSQDQTSSQCHLASVQQDPLTALTREARRLHKLAVNTSKNKSLPVLRRLLKHGVFQRISLVDLFAKQHLVQRKHLLTLLAKELSYASWPLLRNALLHPEISVDSHPFQQLQNTGYPNLWFSNLAQAQEYCAVHGGVAIEVGDQALVKAQD